MLFSLFGKSSHNLIPLNYDNASKELSQWDGNWKMSFVSSTYYSHVDVVFRQTVPHSSEKT